MLWFSQIFVVPLDSMMSHKSGWWLVIRCSLMQIMAEQRIENGLLSGLGFAACQSKNPQIPQSPELPLYKEILLILPKLRKNEEVFWKKLDDCLDFCLLLLIFAA